MAFGVAVLAFFGVAPVAFLALGVVEVGFFFCTAPAVLAGPLVMRPEVVLAETVVSLTMAGACWGEVRVSKGVSDKDSDL